MNERESDPDDGAVAECVYPHRHLRDKAAAERDYHDRHGRPAKPFTVICTACDDMWTTDGDELLLVSNDVRRHAGYHGGLKEEQAELIVTDSTGRELFRHHAINDPDLMPPGERCESCGEPVAADRIACSECGHIPKEARLA
jgi:hypothetical protein